MKDAFSGFRTPKSRRLNIAGQPVYSFASVNYGGTLTL
jgi:hypothetical protein